MITDQINENVQSGMNVYQILENMQCSMSQINNHLEYQQNQILNIRNQQETLRNSATRNGLVNGQASYCKMIRELIENKYSNSNFVARDRHDIDFLAKMLEDYELGFLPLRTKEAWQEKVSLLFSVAEKGWPATIQEIEKSKTISNAFISPRKFGQVNKNKNYRIGNVNKFTRRFRENFTKF